MKTHTMTLAGRVRRMGRLERLLQCWAFGL
jgi:hypothetical protein